MKNLIHGPISFLSMFYLFLSRTYLSYFVLFCPIFLEHFPDFSGFFQVFPSFSKFFQVFPSFSYAVMYFFYNITATTYDMKFHNCFIKKILYFLRFFIFKILFKKWNLDIYKCPFLIFKKKFIKTIYFVILLVFLRMVRMFLFDSYTCSYLFLYMSFFCPILSYFVLFFRNIFPDFSNFSKFFQVFPSFSKFFLCSHTFFQNIPITMCAGELHIQAVKKIMDFLGFFIFKILF